MSSTLPVDPLTIAKEQMLSSALISASVKLENEKITIRPVQLKGGEFRQVSVYDGKITDTKNYSLEEFPAITLQLLERSPRSLTVTTSTEEIHIQFSKKGKPIVHRKKLKDELKPVLQHDRTITRPLPEGLPDPFLQAVGMMTADGRIKADRYRKFVQINEFIRSVTEMAGFNQLPKTSLTMIDFGCGHAYLSFALHHYMRSKMGLDVSLIGVDRTAEVISRNLLKAEGIDRETLSFVQSSISEFKAEKPADIVVALHACDTATDEALAKALEYKAAWIFVAPCCHHNIQTQLSADKLPLGLQPILRDGILRERLGDVLTDTLRAMLLRIAGYQVDVIEFSSPEHTAKNLMIRAHKSSRPVEPGVLEQYQAMKAEFGVTPYLEQFIPAYASLTSS